MLELVDSPDVLADRICRVRTALAVSACRPVDEVEERVAASIAQMGLVARVIAPVLASLTIGNPLLDPRLSQLWWQDQLGGPFPLSVAVASISATADVPSRARTRITEALDDPVERLTSAVVEMAAVSSRVLWGNVASAINSAAALIGAKDPKLAERSSTLAAYALTDRQFDAESGLPGPDFRRSSCCLIYRLASDGTAGVCGDCVLHQLASDERPLRR
jgi:ferric iron reductase protein FhuF